MADDITSASKFRDGTYGDVLLGKIEWAMDQMEEIAGEQREKEKPKLALLALKNLAELAATQAKILGIGVPRAGNKQSLHLHLGNDLKPADLTRAISAYQRTALPAPETTVEVESVTGVEQSGD